MTRCSWAAAHPLLTAYHDAEWGVPEHDDRRLFEFVVLEGQQAGLSWLTVLKKRENLRRAFDNFDPRKVAAFDAGRQAALRADAGIIRNRLKIAAAVANARAFLEVQRQEGRFDRYLWAFVDGRPRQNRWRTAREIPARTPLSDTLSRDLKRRGFRFVGPTICYALMQAVGMVNDHTTDCHRHAELAAGG